MSSTQTMELHIHKRAKDLAPSVLLENSFRDLKMGGHRLPKYISSSFTDNINGGNKSLIQHSAFNPKRKFFQEHWLKIFRCKFPQNLNLGTLNHTSSLVLGGISVLFIDISVDLYLKIIPAFSIKAHNANKEEIFSESQDGWCWREPLWIILSKSHSKKGQLEQVLRMSSSCVLRICKLSRRLSQWSASQGKDCWLKLIFNIKPNIFVCRKWLKFSLLLKAHQAFNQVQRQVHTSEFNLQEFWN